MSSKDQHIRSRMDHSLAMLPPEVFRHLLSYLALPDLLSFARTSCSNYHLAISCLKTLDLAVFPRRIHGTMAFLDTSATNASYNTGSENLNQIFLESNPRSCQCRSHSPTCPQKQRTLTINRQNSHALSVLSSPSLIYLQSLKLNLYDLTSFELAELLSTNFTSLHHLHLNFRHPYIHDPCLPANYWRSHQCSTIWNSFAGLGSKNAAALVLTNLRSLRVERASLTCVQLQRWIEVNPRLDSLRLRCVSPGVHNEFVQWMGSSLKRRWKVLELLDCESLVMNRFQDFQWLHGLDGEHLERMSLRGCRYVVLEVLRRAVKEQDARVVYDSDVSRQSGSGENHRMSWRRAYELLSKDEEEHMSTTGRAMSANPDSTSSKVHATEVLEVDPECL